MVTTKNLIINLTQINNSIENVIVKTKTFEPLQLRMS